MQINKISTQSLARRDFLVVAEQLIPIDAIVEIKIINRSLGNCLFVAYRTVGVHTEQCEWKIDPNCLGLIRKFLGIEDV